MKITFNIDIEPQELFEILEHSAESEEDVIKNVRQAQASNNNTPPNFVTKMFDMFNQPAKPDPKQQETEVVNCIGEQLLEQLKGNDAFLALVKRFISAQK